jgi:SAM-dependent methyltransferase
MTWASVHDWSHALPVTRRWEGRLRLPDLAHGPSQDMEWCEVLENGHWQRIRFHDYAAIYARPGLYEHLFYELLECDSPRQVVQLLAEVRGNLALTEPLRVIDLGAGNGIVGEELRRGDARRIVGVDIIPEAAAAARRDRPRVYDDYLVADLCAPAPGTASRIRALQPNALTCVSALGFGDIPPRAYYHAARFVPVGGLLAFNIKDEFLDARYTYGFSELIRNMVKEKVVRLEATLRYRHRLSVAGSPIHYTAMVATKMAEIPRQMLVEHP